MDNRAKTFLNKVRKLNINARLSSDKTFVIFEPTLPTELINEAIELTDDLCIILDGEQLLLSDEDAAIISSLVDNDEDVAHSNFKLINNSTEESNLPVVYEDYTTESFDKDFDYIRKNLKDIINSGKGALDRMIQVAEASQHPRSYEVVATLIKALADVNKDLLDSHKKKLEVNTIAGTTNNVSNVQNNVIFSGSTSELAKLLKGKQP